MFLFDFLAYYNVGRAVLAGLSPYTVVGFSFISPYPLAVLCALFALLPLPAAYGIYLALNLFLLWKVLRKRMIWALLAFPVLFCLFVGQIDLPLALGIGLWPWLLPLAIVKPQVGIVIAPWLLRRFSRSDWLKALSCGMGLLMVSFALRPDWVREWLLASQSYVDSYAVRVSNLYYLIPAEWLDVRIVLMTLLSVTACATAFFLKEKKVSWVMVHLFAPLSNIYSAAVLAAWIGPLEAAVSYLPVILVGGQIHIGMPMYWLGLVILIRQYWPQIRAFLNRRVPIFNQH